MCMQYMYVVISGRFFNINGMQWISLHPAYDNGYNKSRHPIAFQKKWVRVREAMKYVNVILVVLGLLMLSGLAYCFISLPFVPLSPASRLAAVPPIPQVAPSSIKSVQPLETEKESGATQQGIEGQVSIESMLEAFHSRHEKLPGSTSGYPHKGLRKDLYEIGYAVLSGSESDNLLFLILSFPDLQVRVDGIEALWDAVCALGADEGFKSLDALLSRLDERQAAAIIAATAEALVQATREGTESNADYILMRMHERALPAVPHLIWTSDNHPSPEMRFRTMLFARDLAPDSAAAYAL